MSKISLLLILLVLASCSHQHNRGIASSPENHIGDQEKIISAEVIFEKILPLKKATRGKTDYFAHFFSPPEDMHVTSNDGSRLPSCMAWTGPTTHFVAKQKKGTVLTGKVLISPKYDEYGDFVSSDVSFSTEKFDKGFTDMHSDKKSFTIHCNLQIEHVDISVFNKAISKYFKVRQIP